MKARPRPPVAPFAPEKVPYIGEVAELETLLRAKIGFCPSAPVQQIGKVLATAIIYGALLDPGDWPTWLGALRSNTYEGPEGLWVEFNSANEGLPKRWFADPLTETIIRQWLAKPQAFPAAIDPRDAIAQYLECIGADRPIAVASRIEDLAEMRWRFRMPVLLVECAAGRINWRGISQFEWASLVGGVASPPPLVRSQPDTEDAPASDGDNKDQGATNSRKLPIEFELEKGSRWWGRQRRWLRKAEALQRCVGPVRRLTEGDHESSYIEQQINRWILSRISRQARPPALSKSRVISPEWALTQLCLIKPLLPVLEELAGPDGSLLNSEALEQVYRTFLRAPGQDDRQRRQLLSAIESFQEYLEAVRIDHCVLFDEYEDLRVQEEDVSAHLISPSAYDAARARLKGQDRFTRMRRLYLMLGFRAGLRRAEAESLLVSNIARLDGHLELRVEANRHFTLKTKAARRRIPLGALVPAHEREELIQWMKVRERESAGRADQVLLFSTRERPLHRLEKKDLNGPVEELLRELTGNDAIVYHHLRHSFVTYALATLLLPSDMPASGPPSGFDDDTISASRRQKLLPALLGSGSAGQPAVDGVGVITGHRSNDTTLLWYSHMLDWSIGRYVRRSAVQPGFSAKQLAALTGMSEASIRRRTIARKDVLASRSRRGRGRRRAGDFDHGTSFVDVFMSDVRKRWPIDQDRRLREAPKRRRRPIAPADDITSLKGDWRTLAGVLALIDRNVDPAEIAARFGGAKDECTEIAKAADLVACIATKTGRPRFSFCGSPEAPSKERADPPGIWLLHQDRKRLPPAVASPATELRRKMLLNEAGRDVGRMDRLWPRLVAQQGKQAFQWAMHQFLGRYSEKHSSVRFGGVHDAGPYIQMLLILGVEPASIGIRRSRDGSKHTMEGLRAGSPRTFRLREVTEHIGRRCGGDGGIFVGVLRSGTDIPCPAFPYLMLLMATATDAARTPELKKEFHVLWAKPRLPPASDRVIARSKRLTSIR